MRPRQRVGPLRQPIPPPVGSTYERVLLGIILLFIAIVAISIVVTLTVPSPNTRYGLNVPNPTPPSTAPYTAPLTPPPATAPPTVAPTAPPTAAPTNAPTFPPVVISCPSDVTVVLGSSLVSTFTGGAATATGGCSSPVIQYSDSVVGGLPTIFSRQPPMRTQQHKESLQKREDLQGEMAIPLESESGTQRIPETKKIPETKRFQQRSPSFSFSNLFLSATQSTSTATQGTGVAVSPDWVVWLTQEMGGPLVSVVDRSLPGIVSASYALTSLGTGNCSTSPAQVVGQVAWDHEAQRWVLAHYGDGDILCVYISLTNDPVGPFHALAYVNVTATASFQLAVWGRTYAITLDESPNPPGTLVPVNPLCVLDRESVLTWNGTLPLPGLFCGAALNPLTHLTRWTPVHAEQEAPPPNSTESSGAGTPGAVFMRAIDDEYQFGTMLTPTTDQLEVEHWYNLNWTAATYGAIRYKFSVADFSQRPGTLCGAACVPTPSGTYLNASAGILMPRLVYRYIPATGQESVVATLSSHSNDNDIARFYWFEMRWTTPTTMQTEPLWVLYQQGQSSISDGLHKFLPAPCMDANGTLVIGYSVSNNQTVYPGLQAASRLGNDPLNGLRDPISLHEGAVGSVIPAAPPAWGSSGWAMACDPVEARWFYFSGAVSNLGSDQLTWLDRMRVLGEIVERRWRADDYCGVSDNCTQYITTV